MPLSLKRVFTIPQAVRKAQLKNLTPKSAKSAAQLAGAMAWQGVPFAFTAKAQRNKLFGLNTDQQAVFDFGARIAQYTAATIGAYKTGAWAFSGTGAPAAVGAKAGAGALSSSGSKLGLTGFGMGTAYTPASSAAMGTLPAMGGRAAAGGAARGGFWSKMQDTLSVMLLGKALSPGYGAGAQTPQEVSSGIPLENVPQVFGAPAGSAPEVADPYAYSRPADAAGSTSQEFPSEAPATAAGAEISPAVLVGAGAVVVLLGYIVWSNA